MGEACAGTVKLSSVENKSFNPQLIRPETSLLKFNDVRGIDSCWTNYPHPYYKCGLCYAMSVTDGRIAQRGCCLSVLEKTHSVLFGRLRRQLVPLLLHDCLPTKGAN